MRKAQAEYIADEIARALHEAGHGARLDTVAIRKSPYKWVIEFRRLTPSGLIWLPVEVFETNAEARAALVVARNMARK
jgi:hypothetical protein